MWTAFQSFILRHNNNNGNFICVFECKIVNLATDIGNLQMLLEIGLFIKRKQQQQQKTKTKTKQKPERKNIKIALSLGYPSSYFYNKRYNMLL